MNIINTVRDWIIRQAKQKSTWVGTILGAFVFVWQLIGSEVTALIEAQAHYPWEVMMIKVGVGLVGLICIVYNENKNKP